MLFRIVSGDRPPSADGAVFFFVWGVQDGSVSAFNVVLWAGILAGLGLILFGSRALHRNGHRGLATLLAAVPAIPALLYGLLSSR